MYSSHTSRWTLPLLVAALAAPAAASDVPSTAVTLEQLSFPLQADANVGSITVELAQAGYGYVNVVNPANGDEWLVRNLPLLPSSTGYAHPTITTRIDLSWWLPGGLSGTPVTSVQLLIDVDPSPSVTVADVLDNGATLRPWLVAPLDVAYGGSEEFDGEQGPCGPAETVGIVFDALAEILANTSILTGWENVQAAHNQCAPAAMANSLQYLENAHGLVVAHPNNLGFGTIVPLAPDGTLVGELDDATGRAIVNNRADIRSKGVWPLEGLMTYLAAENLGAPMGLEHRIGQRAGNSGNVLDPNAAYLHAGLGSSGDPNGNGGALDMDYVRTHLSNGVAIALDYAYPHGGRTYRHYVTVIGAGKIKGKWFLMHVSDAVQASRVNGDTKGCDRVDFDWIDVPTKKMKQVNGTIDQILVMEYVPPALPWFPFCFGDGSGTACPCGNAGAPGRGCGNSVDPSGALLTASGTPSVAADTFRLHGSSMPNGSALYFQGTAQIAGGAGLVFGDGLRCAAGSVIRLGIQTNVAGASQYPDAGDPVIAFQGMTFPGAARAYQCWYRNAGVYCTPAPFNLTNGIWTTWLP